MIPQYHGKYEHKIYHTRRENILYKTVTTKTIKMRQNLRGQNMREENVWEINWWKSLGEFLWRVFGLLEWRRERKKNFH